MHRFSARRLTRKENTVKQEIESYRVSDVDNTAMIYFGRKVLPIDHTLDLPDAICDGLIFKQRVVRTEAGDCLLLARWKPDRYMRRSAPAWSQKWFVDKQLFPPDQTRFFTRLQKQAQEQGEVQPSAEGESE
jgi:hypothetical protein